MGSTAKTDIRVVRKPAGDGFEDIAFYVDGELSASGRGFDEASDGRDFIAGEMEKALLEAPGEVDTRRYVLTDPSSPFYYAFAAYTFSTLRAEG